MVRKILVGIGTLLLICVVLAIAFPADDQNESQGDADVAASSTATPSLATVATPFPIPTSTPSPSGPPLTEAEVTEVVDGDTLKVTIDGQPLTVRIIGVDTPETKDPRQPVMCYGVEATAKTQELIDQAGGRVLLEKDVSETDRYDRLLRYVWLEHPDGRRMLNEELVKGGYAQVSTYPPDVKYQDLFLAAQQEARDTGAGLWGECGEFGVPAQSPAPAPPSPTEAPAPTKPEPAPAQSGNCDPSYPEVCIAPYPPDLNCRDVPYRRFAVVPPDPHGFDREGDGVGCEG